MLIQVISHIDYPLPGPDLLSVGPCSEKMWGPSTGAADPRLFFLEKTGDFFLVITVCGSAVSSPQKLATFFAHDSRFTRGLPIFPAYKNLPLLLWGPLFGRTC